MSILTLLVVSLLMTLVVITYMLADKTTLFEEKNTEYHNLEHKFNILKHDYKVLKTGTEISKNTIQELKTEIVIEKAKSFNLQTMVSDLDHENLLLNEKIKEMNSEKELGVFYDQINDVLVLRQDLVYVGDK